MSRDPGSSAGPPPHDERQELDAAHHPDERHRRKDGSERRQTLDRRWSRNHSATDIGTRGPRDSGRTSHQEAKHPSGDEQHTDHG